MTHTKKVTSTSKIRVRSAVTAAETPPMRRNLIPTYITTSTAVIRTATRLFAKNVPAIFGLTELEL